MERVGKRNYNYFPNLCCVRTSYFSSFDIFGGETKAAHTFQHVFILCKE